MNRQTLDTFKNYKHKKNTLVRKYKIIGVLGKGQFGEVYSVSVQDEKTPLALKIILYRNERDAENIKKEIEALTLFKGQTPHIMPILDSFKESNTTYCIVSPQYVGSLGQLINQDKILKMDIFIIVRWFLMLLETLKLMKEKNVLHRDIKPSKILVDNNMNVILCDFGLAKQYVDEIHKQTLCGSPLYMAPEVLTRQYGSKSDVYSLGVTLFEMATSSTHSDFISQMLSKVKKEESSAFKKIRLSSLQMTIKLMIDEEKKRPEAHELLTYPQIEAYQLLLNGKPPKEENIINPRFVLPFVEVLEQEGTFSYRKLTAIIVINLIMNKIASITNNSSEEEKFSKKRVLQLLSVRKITSTIFNLVANSDKEVKDFIFSILKKIFR
jgi:serine/threonine protein kinase